MIYSKAYCPHCTSTKKLLKGKGIAFKVIELDQIGNGDRIQNALAAKTRQRTVPNIFINGRHLGGNSDLQYANKSGKLDQMLQKSASTSQVDVNKSMLAERGQSMLS